MRAESVSREWRVQRRAESTTTDREQRVQEESVSRGADSEFGGSATRSFFIIFGTHGLPHPIWSYAQSGGMELGALLPNSDHFKYVFSFCSETL